MKLLNLINTYYLIYGKLLIEPPPVLKSKSTRLFQI